ncbi:hypothetical protein FisN_26Hu141 [Fistulifera solaris]|uniref:Uncharacterized protein n=1 Tax=Fistulifera solaris TaxID=1519565 RepID=A0A1Z5JY55_FISSO|nr:hypothetical protein FisN_26Hu141 [Fistulifera solaris]|eukprot:GAX18839.1 hypothetical protein FisN_26Hu141 [Fistulifera solaris]
MAILRGNGTVTYVSPAGNDDYPVKLPDFTTPLRGLSLEFGDNGISLYIAGEEDDAIYDTAMYFMEMEELTQEGSVFTIGNMHRVFATYCYAPPPQLLDRIFQVDPSRKVHLDHLMLNTEQSISLATRSHPISLNLWKCKFEDGGTSFLEALEHRISSFGSLTFEEIRDFEDDEDLDLITGLSDDNLCRLVSYINALDHLALPDVAADDVDAIVLMAKVKFLECWIFARVLEPNLVDTLEIVADRLSLTLVHVDDEDFFTEGILALLRRLATVGHFV